MKAVPAPAVPPFWMVVVAVLEPVVSVSLWLVLCDVPLVLSEVDPLPPLVPVGVEPLEVLLLLPDVEPVPIALLVLVVEVVEVVLVIGCGTAVKPSFGPVIDRSSCHEPVKLPDTLKAMDRATPTPDTRTAGIAAPGAPSAKVALALGVNACKRLFAWPAWKTGLKP